MTSSWFQQPWDTTYLLIQFDIVQHQLQKKFPFRSQHYQNPHFELLPNLLLTVGAAQLEAIWKKNAKARNISRSRSPMGLVAPRAWATADLAKLRQLKQDSKARPNWKTVAGKLARSEDDCKRRWKQLQQEDARK